MGQTVPAIHLLKHSFWSPGVRRLTKSSIHVPIPEDTWRYAEGVASVKNLLDLLIVLSSL